MVAEFGMGVALDADGAPPIALPTGDYALSDRTRRDVDVAAMTLAREAYRRARALLHANRECLDDLAANALERETLTREDLDEIFAAHELHEQRRAARDRRRRSCSPPSRRRRSSLPAQWRLSGTPRSTTSRRGARWRAGSTASARSGCSTGSGRC